MRPDEHKKKKNAAYKKKHGIGQTKGQGEDNSGKSKFKGKQNEGVAQHHAQRKNLDEKKNACSEKLKQEADNASESSESEREEVRPARKTFQRREIVSNWVKYESQSDDEAKAESRGESFERLLSMSGDAIAHFRFKDEQEWDIVGGLEDSKVDEDHFGQYLNVDTQQIGEAMACLPLHKVLGLNPGIFPTDEIESMNITAGENREAFLQAYPTVSALLSSSSDAPSTGQHSLTKEDSQKYSHDLQKNGHLDSTSHRTSPLNATQTGSGGPITDACRTTAGGASPVNARLTLNDEELDALLILDSPGETLKNYTQFNVQQQSKSLPPSHLSNAVMESEDNNTAVSSSTSANVMRQQTALPKSPHEKECVSKDSDNLEDWLDSILDD